MTPMDARDPNVAMLELVAARLGEELLADAVFVGGAVAGLLVTDPAAPAIRSTEDVDLVFGAIALADHHEFEARLRARGFVHDTREGAPICRWRIGRSPSTRCRHGKMCSASRTVGIRWHSKPRHASRFRADDGSD